MTARMPIQIALVAVLTGSACAAGAGPDIDPLKAAQVKAGFLYNFAKFVEWPDEAFDESDGDEPAPFVVGIVGDDRLHRVLAQAVDDKQVRGRTIEVKRISTGDDEAPSLATLEQCHMLYLGDGVSPHIESIIDDLGEKPVLTVSDTPGFAVRGGIIGLVLKDRKYAFEINEGEAKSGSLHVSPKLLSLATIVSTEGDDKQ